MKTITVTVARLQANSACADQVNIFRDTFGESADVTADNVRKAQAKGLDLKWFAGKFLPAPARKAYDEALALADEAYHEAIAPARKAYDEAIVQAGKAYGEAIAPARKAYDEAIVPASKAYNEAIALALISALGLRCPPSML